MLAPARPFLIDTAANLTDCVFRGVGWNGKSLHEDDFEHILRRAELHGVHQIIITGTSIVQCERAIRLCRRYPGRLWCTVGVHPAHCTEFTRPIDKVGMEQLAQDPAAVVTPEVWDGGSVLLDAADEAHTQARLSHLVGLVERNRDVVVAVGEVGLDYAELSFCPRGLQEHFFVCQLHSLAPLGLPFLFHSRNCGMRLVELLKSEVEAFPSAWLPLRGVVHSFNGTEKEQEALLSMGFYLSVNASAFRTRELAMQVVRGIPRDRLLMETDAPWCDVRKKDYGFSFVTTTFETVKKNDAFVLGKCIERRNEPCHLVQVVEEYLGCSREAARADITPSGAVGVSEITREELIQVLYQNTMAFFALPGGDAR